MLQSTVLENLPNRILETSIYKLWGGGFPIHRFLMWPKDSVTVILARVSISSYSLSISSSPRDSISSFKNTAYILKHRTWFHLALLSSYLLPPGIACGLGPDELQLGLQIYEVLFQCQRLLVVNSEEKRYLSPDGFSVSLCLSLCLSHYLWKPHTPCKEKGKPAVSVEEASDTAESHKLYF